MANPPDDFDEINPPDNIPDAHRMPNDDERMRQTGRDPLAEDRSREVRDTNYQNYDDRRPPSYDPRYDIEDRSRNEDVEGPREMGFFDHLEELRWRIIKALIALIVASTACAFFLNFIMEDVLLGPINRITPRPNLMNTEMMGQITLAIQVALISGFILSVPVILWQFWGFIKPGLYPKEKKYASWIAVATIFCFLSGVAFAYFVMIPTSLGFTSGFVFSGVENHFSISSYFSFILGFLLASGVVFEMPMLAFALARFGIVSAQFMRKYRRHAIIIILIVAAVITPTPDPFNCLLLAAPLYALYEISIFVAKIATKQRAEAELEREREWNANEELDRRS